MDDGAPCGHSPVLVDDELFSEACMKRVYGEICFASTEKTALNSASDASTAALQRHYSTLHGERSGHFRNSSLAHIGVLSMWHVLQAFGTLSSAVDEGGTNLNVCDRTLTSASCVATFGMWQLTQSFPAVPAL